MALAVIQKSDLIKYGFDTNIGRISTSHIFLHPPLEVLEVSFIPAVLVFRIIIPMCTKALQKFQNYPGTQRNTHTHVYIYIYIYIYIYTIFRKFTREIPYLNPGSKRTFITE